MRLRRVCLLAASLAVAGMSSLASAQVTGKIKLDGKAPEPKEIDMSGVKECAAQHADPVFEETIVASDKGELANVVVMVKAEEAAALGGAVPAEAVTLDQKGCVYTPHVIPMMVGQKLQIKNSDPFLHNVHSLAQTNPAFNFGQPNKDPGKEVESPKAAEVFKIKCDVHPWMGAWMIVLEHPFFATSKADGTFEIKGLPDGDYGVQAWHEKLGTQDGKVSVKGGKGTVDFTFKAVAQGPAADPKDPQLAAAKTDKAAAEVCTMDCCKVPPKAPMAVAAALDCCTVPPKATSVQTAQAK